MIMFNNGIHYKDNSLLDKSNPFLKLILTVLFILATLIAKSTIAHIFLLSFLLILLFSTSIPIKRFLKAVWLTRYLLIIVIVIDALIFRSLTHTLIATLSFISIVIMISLMLMTTKAQDLMLTLEVVFIPYHYWRLSS